MRYPPEQKQKTRISILDVAERLFRERGYNGIGIDGVAAEAKLTSGALYKHFSSKNALFREVLRAGISRLSVGIARFQRQYGEGWLAALADWYMGAKHRADIGTGCALPSLSAEVVKADLETRALYEKGLVAAVEVLMTAPPFNDREQGSQRAWATLALLAGGVMLSRAVVDPLLAEVIASSVRTAIRATNNSSSEEPHHHSGAAPTVPHP